MSEREEFIESLFGELERRRVSRDNPVHRRLIAGDFSREMLQEWGRQQWLFMRAFPGFLCLVAGNAPDFDTRGELLTLAYQVQTGRVTGGPSSIELWETVCEAFGLSRADMEATEPLPGTWAMLATQELVARRSFVEGAAGLLLGALGEVGPFMEERRKAMAEKYRLPAPALRFFEALVPAGQARRSAEMVARFALSPEQQEAARRAVRMTLSGRWECFSDIGRAFGWSVA